MSFNMTRKTPKEIIDEDESGLTDIERFEKAERELATKKRPARTWEQFVDETAKDFPDMTRLEVERSLKRLMAKSRPAADDGDVS